MQLVAGIQSHRSVGLHGQSVNELGLHNDSRIKKRDGQILQRKISPNKLIGQHKQGSKKTVRKSTMVVIGRPSSKERRSSKSNKRSDPLFVQATQKALKTKKTTGGI